MDEARSSCPGPTAEDTTSSRTCSLAIGATGPRQGGEARHPQRPAWVHAALPRGQALPRQQRWTWLAEDLFDEDKW
ncbi:hypothetical protein [Rhizobacter sp. OV335]|jgi:hypothetical protein|uniref:hypothetical protein n=1 Tax=Rhizobacter sp. OV335 TaxID=1500264 RepID=UPI0009134E39|nr:hypothetical protein [Rhizobacter sp. OV335]SHM36172.1 hypothetical protein SAMN02787076_01096 [Rhizobacter sp. OV335]